MAGTILVVDDDHFFRRARHRHAHAAWPPHRHRRRTPCVPSRRRRVTPFDLVITDVVMPGMDGFALTAKLRERDPDQEVILVSARPDVKGSEMALRAGAADCLTKPVDEDGPLPRGRPRPGARGPAPRARPAARREPRVRALPEPAPALPGVPRAPGPGVACRSASPRISPRCATRRAPRCGWWMTGASCVLRAYRGLLGSAVPGGADRARRARWRRGCARPRPWLAREERSPVLYVPLRGGRRADGAGAAVGSARRRLPRRSTCGRRG